MNDKEKSKLIKSIKKLKAKIKKREKSETIKSLNIGLGDYLFV